ncbi:stage II sporulation protein M [Candidatus Woesearchaeota archaeon]|nr:stage II sporulation protein M [Candidatus Woesearchaeota archaeon]
MLEFLFKTKWVEKRPTYSLYLGVIATLISFFTSYILFRQAKFFIPIATLLFTVIITLPVINKLFLLEEKKEKKQISFFKKHEAVIDFFIYFFIGAFVVFFVLAIISPDLVFSESQLYGRPAETPVVVNTEEGLPPPPPLPGGSELGRIFKNNLYLMVITFILSLFYGAGALFLITLNGAIFASALVNVIRMKIPHLGYLFTFSFMACNFGIMFFHMIPEVASYFLAAIAGGILSTALIREKFWSENFRKIVKDSLLLLLAAILVLGIAAFVEVEISKRLFTSGICVDNTYLIIAVTLLIVFGILFFELFRRKVHHSRKV